MSIKKLAIMTSGGDAPGMNALLYAIVKYSLKSTIIPVGIYGGFSGLCSPEPRIEALTLEKLEPFRMKGGTILGTSRYGRFIETGVQEKAAERLKQAEIERLIVIGGEGSYKGAYALSQKGIPVTCLPASIDNDVPGSDVSVGFFSALQSVLSAIENIKATARSHQRIFIIEVMGNHCGDLARFSGLLESCFWVIPTLEDFSKDNLIKNLKNHLEGGHRWAIICIAEKICDVTELANDIEGTLEHETRSLVLGHLQRGASTNVIDCFFGLQLGAFAIERALKSKNLFEMIGFMNGKLAFGIDPNGKEMGCEECSQSRFLSYARTLSAGAF